MVWKVLAVSAVLIVPPLLLRLLGRPLSGSLLGIPYNFELPTPGRAKRALWDPSSDRLLVPHLYGWGYSLNVHALGRKLGLLAE
jgi:hypothetical protein